MFNLFENPTPIVVLAALVELVLAAAMLRTGRPQWMWSMAGVAGVALLGVLISRWVVTDREQIEAIIEDGRQAIEANDFDRAMRNVAPSTADARESVQSAMDRVEFSEIRVLSQEIAIDPAARKPRKASVRLSVLAMFRDRHGQFAVGKNWVNATLQLEKISDRWLVTGVTETGPGRL